MPLPLHLLLWHSNAIRLTFFSMHFLATTFAVSFALLIFLKAFGCKLKSVNESIKMTNIKRSKR